MKQTKTRGKVKGTLIGVDSNAFSLMGHFGKLAKQQGFTNDWIADVKTEAMDGDYNHLLRTLSDNMTMEDA